MGLILVRCSTKNPYPREHVSLEYNTSPPQLYSLTPVPPRRHRLYSLIINADIE